MTASTGRNVTRRYLEECLRMAERAREELTDESHPIQHWYAEHVAALANALLRLKGWEGLASKDPEREFLLLKAVHDLNGQPVAVFGRLELPLGTQLGCHEVIPLGAEDAAKLATLLDRLEEEQGQLVSEPYKLGELSSVP